MRARLSVAHKVLRTKELLQGTKKPEKTGFGKRRSGKTGWEVKKMVLVLVVWKVP